MAQAQGGKRAHQLLPLEVVLEAAFSGSPAPAAGDECQWHLRATIAAGESLAG